MATITPSTARKSSANTSDIRTITWSGIATGDTVTPVDEFSGPMLTACIHIKGTFGGATVALEGSNDGASYVTINDIFGFAISMTSEGIAELSTSVKYVRIGVSGGTGDSITAILVARD